MKHKCFYGLTSGILVVLTSLTLWGCAGTTVKLYPTAEEQYRVAMKRYGDGNYLAAIDGLQKVLYNFSGASMVDSAQYYMAMSYFHLEDYYLAANEFERLANAFPGSPFIDDAQYMAGFCYFKSTPDHYGLDQTELGKAIQLLEDFITDFPESDLVPDAREAIRQARDRLARKKFEAGKTYYKLGEYDSAKIYFQYVIDNYTETEWAAQALFHTAEIERKSKRFEEAERLYNNFLVIYPEHKKADEVGDKLKDIKERLAESEEES